MQLLQLKRVIAIINYGLDEKQDFWRLLFEKTQIKIG